MDGWSCFSIGILSNTSVTSCTSSSQFSLLLHLTEFTVALSMCTRTCRNQHKFNNNNNPPNWTSATPANCVLNFFTPRTCKKFEYWRPTSDQRLYRPTNDWLPTSGSIHMPWKISNNHNSATKRVIRSPFVFGSTVGFSARADRTALGPNPRWQLAAI